MSKMIQIRNVPDELHAELYRRAKLRRQTLTAYLEGVLEREGSRPSIDEIYDEVSNWPTFDWAESPVERLNRERDEREESWRESSSTRRSS